MNTGKDDATYGNQYSQHVQDNQERYLRELTDFLSIPSVSTLSQHKADVLKAAEWVKGDLRIAQV